MRRLALFLLVSLSITGCVTGQIAWSPEKRCQITTRTYNYNSRYMFEQISTLLEENGYGLEIMNKNDGIIRTLSKTSGITGLSSISVAYYVRVIPIEENQTKISVLISSQGSMYVPSGSAFRGGNWAPTGDEMIDEKHYKSFFDGVERRLKNSVLR